MNNNSRCQVFQMGKKGLFPQKVIRLLFILGYSVSILSIHLLYVWKTKGCGLSTFNAVADDQRFILAIGVSELQCTLTLRFCNPFIELKSILTFNQILPHKIHVLSFGKFYNLSVDFF